MREADVDVIVVEVARNHLMASLPYFSDASLSGCTLICVEADPEVCWQRARKRTAQGGQPTLSQWADYRRHYGSWEKVHPWDEQLLKEKGVDLIVIQNGGERAEESFLNEAIARFNQRQGASSSLVIPAIPRAVPGKVIMVNGPRLGAGRGSLVSSIARWVERDPVNPRPVTITSDGAFVRRLYAQRMLEGDDRQFVFQSGFLDVRPAATSAVFKTAFNLALASIWQDVLEGHVVFLEVTRRPDQLIQLVGEEFPHWLIGRERVGLVGIGTDPDTALVRRARAGVQPEYLMINGVRVNRQPRPEFLRLAYGFSNTRTNTRWYDEPVPPDLVQAFKEYPGLKFAWVAHNDSSAGERISSKVKREVYLRMI